MDTFIEKVSRNKILRPIFKFFLWDIVYHCEVCGKRMDKLTLNDFAPVERAEVVRENAQWMLNRAFKCRNESCPESKKEGGHMIG